ncbi:MAG: hypothetical protein F6K16_33205, partial [Symploca sp. SIO2B6]|nr:hypothetical protein [Symploca sp. SIO2B6]
VEHPAWPHREREVSPEIICHLIFNFQYGVLAEHRMTGLDAADASLLLKSRKMPTVSMFGAPKAITSKPTAPKSAAPKSTVLETLDGTQDWSTFVAFCGGNPAWLLMEAGGSRTVDIPRFMADPPLERTVVETFNQILLKLTTIEYLLLSWLLLKPLSYQCIRQLDSPGISSAAWDDALLSLERRNLVIRDKNQRYRIDPPLLEYILSERIAKNVADELLATGQPSSQPTKFNILQSCPLFHGTASAKRQQWLQQHLVQKIVERFQRNLFQAEQIDRLQILLSHLQHQPRRHHGYRVSNLLNIAIALRLPLSEFEFRGLCIRHVDLRHARLSGANFDGCRFQDVMLPLNPTGKITADMTPEGDAIAIGDETGTLFYWHRDADSFRLQHICLLSNAELEGTSNGSSEHCSTEPMPIEHILFQESHTLIVATAHAVYIWWVDETATPDKLIDLHAPVSHLARSNQGKVAIGLSDGTIFLWDGIGYRTLPLKAHTSDISTLAFSPDGRFLASIGLGNRVLIWDLSIVDNVAPPYKEVELGMNICWHVSWTQDTLLRAELMESNGIRLRVGDREIREQAIASGSIIGLQFSQNGRYLSGSATSSQGRGFLFCWDWSSNTLRWIQSPKAYANVLATCAKGRWMLVLHGNQLQMFDLQQQELLWQIEPQAWDSRNYSHFSIHQVQGLSTAERKMMNMRINSNVGPIELEKSEEPAKSKPSVELALKEPEELTNQTRREYAMEEYARQAYR